MKVALVIDTWFPQVGGGQANAWEISKRLAGNGTSIDIITRNTGEDNLKLPYNLKVIKLGAKAKPFDYFSKVVFLFNAYFYIYKKDYDLVHAHAFLPGITARLLSILNGISSIFTVHGTSIGTRLNNPFKERIEKFILTQILYNAQITVSQDFKKVKNINDKIFYISNGVDTKNFDKVKTSKFKNPTIIFVGRLHPQKNLPNLIKALAIVKENIPQINLIIVGEGQEKESIRKTVLELNLESNVILKGELPLTTLIGLYKYSHLFVLPSIYEGQPLTLLEAWAAKIPAVVSATSDCAYLVKNGVNGYLIDNPLIPAQIAAQIKKALGANNLQKMGQNGYNLVSRTFSWDRSAQKTLKLYESLTKAKN